ncbi:MAG: translocation/assembly module TamB domain-containing protein [Pseudomonadota bacterium]|nr:translocation/assembly module TamB domain-containing protein [Pseudomonadota bacterium]
MLRALSRFSLGLLGVLFSLLLMLTLIVWLLLGTTTGNRWVLDRVIEVIPGNLQVDDWQGHLLDRITVSGVQYQLDHMEIRLDRFEAELEPAALLSGWLEFSALSLGNLVIIPPARSDNDAPQAPALPTSLALPFGVRIDHLTLSTLHLDQNQLIRDLEARQLAAWRRFQLASLSTRTVADVTIDLSAQGSLAEPVSIDGQARWQRALAASNTLQAEQLTGRLEVSGALTDLQLRHQLLTPLQIQSEGQWRLAKPEQPLLLTHQWPAQPLPLALPQPLSLGDGKLITQGPLTDLHLKGETRLLSGEQSLNLSVDSQLSSDALTVQQLTLDDGDQQLESQGELRFSPLQWNLNVAGQLNTGLLHPLFPGKLTIQGNTQGRFDNGQWALSPSRLRLDGTVRQQPLTATASVEGGQQRLQLKSALRWGDNRLSGHGTLLPDWHLDTRTDLNQLSQLHPALQGQLDGNIQVRGALASPTLSGNLNGQALGWQAWTLASLQARFRALGIGEQHQSLALNSGPLRQSGTEQLSSARLNLNGTLANHAVTVNLQRDDLQLETRLQGRVGNLDSNPDWQGILSDTGLTHSQLGHWQQAQDSRVQLASRRQALASFCLTQQQSRFCLEGRHDNRQLEAHTSVNALPLALARALLGPDFIIEGTLHGEAFLQGSVDNPTGRYHLQTRDALIAARHPDMAQELAVKTLSLQGHLQDQRLSHTLTLASDRVSADATLEHGLTPDTPLTGQVAFQIDSLAPLGLLTTDLRDIQGEVRGDVGLAGSLRRPLMNGQVRLHNGHALIPALGTAVSDLQLTVAGSPRGLLTVDGTGSMGDGNMQLSGTLDPGQWPARVSLTLKGERLLVADRPDARVRLDPSLTLSGDLNALLLGGKILIPEADIRPVELPEGAITVSEDQVLVHQEAVTDRHSLLAIKVGVGLGDEVHFQGFGLDARLGGDLQVEQQPGQPPQLNGELVIREGRYRAYGQNLAISDGQLIFQGPADNPGLDIRAIRKIPSESIVVGVQLTGTLQEPQANLFSEPTMEQSQAMSYLLTGRPLERGSKSDNSRIAQALALYGLEKGSGVTEKIGEKLGVDEISVGSDWETDDAALMLGKQLSDRLYLTYAVGLFDAISTVMLRYTLTRQLHLEARSSTKANSLDLIWEKELQ